MVATLSDYVLDNGLSALQMATHIYVTNAEQTTYANVVGTNGLAHNTAPREFALAPTARSPDGSKVPTLSTTIAGYNGSGEAHFWYFVDAVNSRLLARGALAGSVLYTFHTIPAGPGSDVHYPAYVPPDDNVQIPSIASNGIVDPWVLNNGLEGLKASADKVYLCNALPTNWTQATSTFALGNKNYGAGGVFSGQTIVTSASPAGRNLPANSMTGGDVTASGTATHIGVVDSANSRFLVGMTLGLGGPAAVTNGQHFTLGSFIVKLVSNP